MSSPPIVVPYYVPMYMDTSCTGTYVCTKINETVTACKCVHSPEYVVGMFVVLIIIAGAFLVWLGRDWWRNRR